MPREFLLARILQTRRQTVVQAEEEREDNLASTQFRVASIE